MSTVVATPLLGTRVLTEQTAHALWERARMAIGPCALDWTPNPPNLIFADTLTQAQTGMLATLTTGATSTPAQSAINAIVGAAASGLQGPQGDQGDPGDPGPPGPTNLTLETPVGAVDGLNLVYALSRVPAALLLFRNGLHLRAGAQNDYVLAGSVVTFLADNACQPGDSLIAVLT